MFVERIAQWGQATFRPPAGPEAIEACTAMLGRPLPDDLRDLLVETNGVEGEYGVELMWSAERIAEDNARFRASRDYAESYMPFDGMVFFSDAGNGDQFAVALSGNQEIYVWDHENDSRTWVAPTVMQFLEIWMTGRLPI
ncbi:SMI1/KNR4 family protein [Kribbella sp. NPDC058245]|uniref:SMI1/KNR4 family protein n=1 Tax=Kribbella sp. NPDC058245 TaxID=3346399 RepID=UPI0036EA7415